MIEVRGLCKRYGNIVALSDVSFDVPQGKIVGFLGANGAGKTTTLDIICGCLSADEGMVKIADIDIVENPIKAKQVLGYLPDDPPLYTDMKVKEYIAYSAYIHKVPRSKISYLVNEVMEKLAITDVQDRLIANLSKGYKQRVGLAQTLVHNPSVLIMDEPTEGLDPNQIIQIRELIKSFAGNHTIFLSSHILSEVQQICDYIIIIHEGKIVAQGTYDELIREVSSSNTYLLQVASGNLNELVTKLKNMSEIKNVSIVDFESYKVEFEVSSNLNVLDTIVKMVVDDSFGIRQLSPNAQSLEQVFLKLTK